jgi:hypothetical protein
VIREQWKDMGEIIIIEDSDGGFSQSDLIGFPHFVPCAVSHSDFERDALIDGCLNLIASHSRNGKMAENSNGSKCEELLIRRAVLLFMKLLRPPFLTKRSLYAILEAQGGSKPMFTL